MGSGRRWLVAALVVGASSGLLAGRPVHWREVDLGGARPVALAAAGGRVLVGGQAGPRPSPDAVAPAQPAPALFVLEAGRGRPVPLEPATPYGRVADVVAVAAGPGGRIDLLGGARGGAHGNIRWTVWSGDADRVVEHEQVFWVFGGHEAGTMVAQVATPDGTLVVGGWAGAHGMDIALWQARRARGDTWERMPSEGTELASSPSSQRGARAAGAAGSLVVVAGESIELGETPHRVPVAWVWPRRDEPVRRLLLPSEGPGRADSVACGVDACWIGGVAAGQAALWRVGAAAAPHSAEQVELPPVTVDPDTVVLAVVGDGPGVVVARDGRTRWVGGGVETVGPDGIPIAAVGGGSAGIVVIVERAGARTLWTAGTPRTGGRRGAR